MMFISIITNGQTTSEYIINGGIQGDISKQSNLNNNVLGDAITHLGNEGTITIKGDVSITGDFIVPEGIVLNFYKGSKLIVNNGVQLTINSEIKAGNYQIFDIGTSPIHNIRISNQMVLPEWFNARINDNMDDSVAINNAIASTIGSPIGNIYFMAGVYDIHSTIELPSNIKLIGNCETILLSHRNIQDLEVINSQGTYDLRSTFYPTTILKNKDAINENITIIGIKFNGNWSNSTGRLHSYGIKDTTSDYIANLIRFDNVTDLKIKDVDIYNFSSNYNDLEGEYEAMAIEKSKNIYVENLRFYDSRIEGIRFNDSEDIIVDRFHSYNDYIWTPIHFWYCTNVTLQNSIIDEIDNDDPNDINRIPFGSTINFTVKNSIIQNCKIYGGSGIDIGNEVNHDFDISNITIKDNYLERVRHGVYSENDNDEIEGLSIINNTIKLHGRIDNGQNTIVTSTGVKLFTAKDVTILNNKISALDDKRGSIGVRFDFKMHNLLIQNNIIEDIENGIYSRVINSGNIVDRVRIIGNTIKTIALNGRSTYRNNYSTGVFFAKVGGNTGESGFSNWIIRDNYFNNEGSWVYNYDNTPLILENFNIINNVFKSSENGCNRGLDLNSITDLTINNNKLHNSYSNKIHNNSNVIMHHNTINYKDYNPDNAGLGFRIEQNTGIGSFKYNIMYNNLDWRGVLFNLRNTDENLKNDFFELIDEYNYSR